MSNINTEVLETEILENAEITAEIDEHPDDTVVEKGLRKLNPKYKSKAEKKAERAALSELETEDYVPEEHEVSYKVSVDRKIY